MFDLPEEFLSRMKDSLGGDCAAFLHSYERPPERAVRVNILKISAEEFEKISPFALSPVEWEKNGFYIAEDKPGKHVYHHAGLYYVQEPSAMCAAPLLEQLKGERVLDLCSAPGGKGTQLAQNMAGEGILFLNEINFSRAKILSSNVERMGIKNAVVTCASPAQLAEAYAGYFTKILVDAPCSGEGMFKKEAEAIPNWSLENVRLCADRQRDILRSADILLARGGELVYSTCTFAPEEDEQQIADFLKSHPEYELLSQKKLYPHKIRGEGHFAAHLVKRGGEEDNVGLLKPDFKDKKLINAFNDFARESLKISFGNLHFKGKSLYALPAGCPELRVQVLRAGVHLGDFEKDRFVPSHSLAMCLRRGEAECMEVSEREAIEYLSGLTLNCGEARSGWRVVTYNGFPLGWCKCVNGTAKNHYPKGLRIK